MAKITPNIIPYTTFYNDFPELIGKPVYQSVMFYLLCKRQEMLKRGKEPTFHISANKIASKHSMDWRSVDKALQYFHNIGLIILDGDVCEFQSDKFESLIEAFCSLSSRAEKTKFREALADGDYDALEEMGYVLIDGSSENVTNQQGWFTDKRTEVPTFEQKHIHSNRTTDISTEVPTKEQNYMQKNRTFCSNVGNLTGIGAAIAESMCKITEGSVQMLEEYRNFFIQNYTKDELRAELQDFFSEFCSNVDFEEFLAVIFDKKRLEGSVQMSVGFCSFVGGVLFKCTKYLHLNRTEIINNINNKKITGNEVSLIGGEEIFFEEEGEVNDEEQNFQSHSEKYLEAVKKEQHKVRSKYKNFSVEEIDEIISDINKAKDRPDKIFINQLWEVVSEFVQEDQDESDDDELPVDKIDPNGCVLYPEELKQLLTQATDSAIQIIETGTTESGEELSGVTTEQFDPENVNVIVAWEISQMNHGEYAYVIDKAAFKDMYSQIEAKENKRTKRGGDSEDDYRYMQGIIQLGDSDDTISELSAMEAVVYYFLRKFFKISEDGRVEDYLLDDITGEPKMEISKLEFSQFKKTLKEEQISEKEFISVMFNSSFDGYGSLNIRPRMFSANSIRNWNTQNNPTTAVDDLINRQ